jgi:Kef-type K+ transport system membrane component KefB
MFSQDLYHFLMLLATVLGAFMICKKTQISLGIGYLLSGIILGPLGVGLFQKTDLLNILSHVGLLLFLFTVGLEIPFHRIRALKRYIFGFGFVQVFLTTAILATGLSFFLPFSTALILSIALSFSSTAIVVQLLSERHELTTYLGRTALSILLFQDIIAILMFVYLGFSESGDGAGGEALLKSGAGFLLSLGLGFVIAKTTERALALYRYSEFITAFVILVVLSFSILTESFHLSSELGAFIAGIAMASTHWRHQISTELHPFRTLFLAIFFIVMGLEIQVWPDMASWGWIVLGVVGITALKAFVVMGCAWWFEMQGALSLGVLIGGCSEFLFMILPSQAPVLGVKMTNGVLVMGFVSMVITPFLFLLSKKFGASRATHQTIKDRHPVVVAGFGHIGQTIARILEHNFIPFVIIDYDKNALDKARELNYKVIEGDARDIEFLKRIKIYEAKVFLITFGHLVQTADVVRGLRRKFPELVICVQVRDYNEAARFSGLGVYVIIPESIESGMQMAAVTLQCLGFSQDYAQKMAHFPQNPLFFGARK